MTLAVPPNPSTVRTARFGATGQQETAPKGLEQLGIKPMEEPVRLHTCIGIRS